MTRYILDTNTCIFFLRGKLNFSDFIEGNWRDSCCISEVTILELYYGAENSNNPQKHYEAVDIFLHNLKVLPVGMGSKAYAKEKVRLKKAGIPLHDEFDLIIGASAIANNLTLITDNVKHFKQFKDIRIENWAKCE
ncbi:MAG: PIN domain-containing protein [Candidatus Symbiothrix sp.]|jgi:tRNA(fMet)-specific endonuclease VapC|nr:PIN domain-containing protein [Candidatus Symbiothrix sp.]